MALTVEDLTRANKEFFEKSPDKKTPSKVQFEAEEEGNYDTHGYSTTSKITLMRAALHD